MLTMNGNFTIHNIQLITRTRNEVKENMMSQQKCQLQRRQDKETELGMLLTLQFRDVLLMSKDAIH